MFAKKSIFRFFILLFAILLISGTASASPLKAPLGTGFTYQGRLLDGGVPANGSYDLQFKLFNALSGGSQVGSTVVEINVPVTNGLFTVQLDFGAVFDGTALYLEIGVRPGGSSGSFTTLTPRQSLSAAPYTLYATQAGSVPWSGLTGVPSAWGLTGNVGTNPTTNYLGTRDNQPLELRVNGQRGLRLEPNGTSPNIIAGYNGNMVTAGVYGAVIGGGGGASTDINTVSANYGVVGGGIGNNAAGVQSTVAGGENNLTSDYAAIGGGSGNAASGWYSVIGGGGGTLSGATPNKASDSWSTVGGGRSNTASGPAATVGGGDGNTASSVTATVPGGSGNTASGPYSFAAGAVASAADAGSFVWSSSEATASWGDDTFTIRAEGGTRFYTASGTSTGVQLSSGGSSWGSISDRNVKANFRVVDNQWLLNQLALMPIQTWNLKSQATELRHIGPVAQDFNGLLSPLFGTVEDPLRINNMDAVGVSLAAIQGLYRLNQQQAAEIQSLQARLARMEKSGSPNASSRLPLFWVVVIVGLGLSQVGIFLFLRRRLVRIGGQA